MRDKIEVINVFEGQQAKLVAEDFVSNYPELMNDRATDILT